MYHLTCFNFLSDTTAQPGFENTGLANSQGSFLIYDFKFQVDISMCTALKIALNYILHLSHHHAPRKVCLIVPVRSDLLTQDTESPSLLPNTSLRGVHYTTE
jgi:hypothetical protein